MVKLRRRTNGKTGRTGIKNQNEQRKKRPGKARKNGKNLTNGHQEKLISKHKQIAEKAQTARQKNGTSAKSKTEPHSSPLKMKLTKDSPVSPWKVASGGKERKTRQNELPRDRAANGGFSQELLVSIEKLRNDNCAESDSSESSRRSSLRVRTPAKGLEASKANGQSPSAASTLKRKRSDDSEQTPRSLNSKSSKMRDESEQQRKRRKGINNKEVRVKTGTELVKLPPMAAEPEAFVKCCVETDTSKDETELWCCQFQPDGKGKTTDIIAVCGGNCVHFLDCKLGKVVSTYEDRNKKEKFYAVAWTAIRVGDDAHQFLAVAGNYGTIHVLDYGKLQCELLLDAHKNMEISWLKFHKTKPEFLFSGSKDGTIIMWKLVVTAEAKPRIVKVTTFIGNQLFQVLMFTFAKDFLVAVTNRGCFAWRINFEKGYREPDIEFVHPKVEDKGKYSYPSLDAIESLNENTVVTKSSSDMWLWDLDDLRLQQNGPVDIIPFAHLRWSDNYQEFLRPSFNSKSNVLCCGDGEGNVWVYNLSEVLKDKFFQKEKPLQDCEPSLIIPWPEFDNDEKLTKADDVIINMTAISGSRLVAVTDNNIICVWKLNKEK